VWRGDAVGERGRAGRPSEDIAVDGRAPPGLPRAREVLGRPKIRTLAHVFLWECGYKRLKLAQLLGQLGAILTWVSIFASHRAPHAPSPGTLSVCSRIASQ
jgi:hypothetical protein